jgi:hypothetical protein
MIKPDIYSNIPGDLNTERITKYRKLAEDFTIEEGTVRDIFCKGAEWGIEVSERLNPATIENVAYVIHDRIAETFLDKNDYFTTKIRNAKTFSSESEADTAMKYYIKIYKQTDRSDTTSFLEVLPVEIQISIKE